MKRVLSFEELIKSADINTYARTYIDFSDINLNIAEVNHDDFLSIEKSYESAIKNNLEVYRHPAAAPKGRVGFIVKLDDLTFEHHTLSLSKFKSRN